MNRFRLFEAGEETEKNKDRNQSSGGETPFLDNFGKDLTKLAEEGKLEPVIGRDKEIFQILWVLARKQKNNPVVIGDPGVGKTAIIEGIAQKIKSGECPPSIKDKRIVYLDMGSLIAGASAQGAFEKRVKTLLNELENNKDIILFIDEIHLMVNSQMAIDAANMFKPALARGDMRCIGATTLNEFRNSIEKDGALERRFQKVMVDQTSIDDTIEILNKIKHRYEEYHSVSYSPESIIACVKLSDRYMPDRFFPDKAIDMLDEVGARVRLMNSESTPPEIIRLEKDLIKIRADKTRLLQSQDFEGSARLRMEEVSKIDRINDLKKNIRVKVVDITEDDISEVMALKTGIPIKKLTQDEGSKLLEMEKELKMQVIGQDEAVTKIAKFVRRSRAGLKDPKRPAGVFLFLGETGVGKTHLVKTLAKYLFGSEDNMIRVDMSEYKEKHNVSRMIGAPPSYVGYGEGGQLTEKVRRKPYCVILFDEIEKAHPDVLSIMLQIFDDGHLTDGGGRKVDFKNTIIIMTSNIGTNLIRAKSEADEYRKSASVVGFGSRESEPSKVVMEESKKELIKRELNRTLAPEFINRIDEIIIFSSLGKEEVYKIIDIEIRKLNDRLKAMGYTLSITNNVKDLLMEVGYDEAMGARPLKRAIQTKLEDPISDEILKKTIKDKIEIDYDKQKGQLIINGNYITEKFKYLKKWNHLK